MTREEFDKLSGVERDCLEFAIGDFWNEYNFYERIKGLLDDIERTFYGNNPRYIHQLPQYAEELQDVCNDAVRFWGRYAEKALKEDAEYIEELEDV